MPGGYKGMGEGGAIGSPAAVANAIGDALVPFGVAPMSLPVGPSDILALLAGAKSQQTYHESTGSAPDPSFAVRNDFDRSEYAGASMTDYPVVDADLSGEVGPPAAHFRQIDRLRDKYRYFWNASAQGYWVLTRFADIREAFQMSECSATIRS